MLGVFYAGGVDTDQLKTLPGAGVNRAVLPLPSKSPILARFRDTN